MSVQYDASLTKDSERNAQQYKDLNLNMTRNPITGDVAKVTDVQSVKRSLNHLITLMPTDKPFHSEVSSGIQDLLFEPMDGITANVLATRIELVINNFEPRIILAGVRVFPLYDNNKYQVLVDFYLNNTPADLQTAEIILERLR
jgi:phage baseplate assembly protein W